jgi:Fur family ferric uptake transcriptional regulator
MKRNTKQGEIIFSVIRTANRPLTSIEIHQLAAEQIPRIGIATTYRHLKSLTKSHHVVGVDYPGQPPRYEWADGKDKVHFACRACKKLFALDDTSAETPPVSVPGSFEVQGFEIMLYGFCPSCAC